MILKDQLIKEIEQLPPTELMLVKDFVQVLTKHLEKSQFTSIKQNGYLETRKALANYQGNLSDDIILEREE